MATSGYRDEYVTQWDTLRFSWSRSSYSIADNTSTVSWYLQLISGSSGYISSSASKNWSVTVNGASYSGTTTVGIANNTTKTLGSGSTTIYHNADGTKTFTYSFSQQFDINFNGWIGAVSGSSSGTLDTIPRQATITSAPDFTDADNPTIYYSNPAGSSVTSLQACISLTGQEADIAYRSIPTSGTSYTFTLTDAEKMTLYNATKNSLSRTVMFFVRTNLGGTNYLSYLTRKFTVTNCAPTLNPTVVDTGTISKTLTGDPNNKLIRYYNTANVTFNATAVKGASISSMKVTCGNASRTSDGVMGYVDSGTFNFSVTDSRGQTASATVTKTLIEYIPLTCNLSVTPNLVDGSTANLNVAITGNYFEGSFGAVTNSLTVEYRYKTDNGEYPTEWTSKTATVTDGKYAVSDIITGLNYTSAYTFQARAKDKVYTGYVNVPDKVVKILPVFDWGKDDFNFNVPVSINGGLTIPVLASGNCNDITTTGVYYIGTSGTNKPFTGLNGWLTVRSFSTDHCAQDYVTYLGARYYRNMVAGEWTDWDIPGYPVNSIYISYSHTSPAELFGGTWERITNRFLWGSSSTGTIGSTGGEATHKLTVSEIPSHQHPYVSTGQYSQTAGGWTSPAWGTETNSTTVKTGDAGGGEAHNNMPPYIRVSIWRRTA